MWSSNFRKLKIEYSLLVRDHYKNYEYVIELSFRNLRMIISTWFVFVNKPVRNSNLRKNSQPLCNVK